MGLLRYSRGLRLRRLGREIEARSVGRALFSMDQLSLSRSRELVIESYKTKLLKI